MSLVNLNHQAQPAKGGKQVNFGGSHNNANMTASSYSVGGSNMMESLDAQAQSKQPQLDKSKSHSGTGKVKGAQPAGSSGQRGKSPAKSGAHASGSEMEFTQVQ